MQIAAYEARIGHPKLADEIRTLIDKANSRPRFVAKNAIPIARPRGEASELRPSIRMSPTTWCSNCRRAANSTALFASRRPFKLSAMKDCPLVERCCCQASLEQEKPLPPRRSPANWGFHFLSLDSDGLITKFLGETAAKLRIVFETLSQTRGVYLFDEFDSIGSSRGLSNDVGEIRRVVNSFLQMVEQDQSDSLIIAATFHVRILDPARFRRFDDIIKYELPDRERIIATLKARLGNLKTTKILWGQLARLAQGLSFADITRVLRSFHQRFVDPRPYLRNASTNRRCIARPKDFYGS